MKAIATKPPTSASVTRFEIVMVKRSLEAANAIKAGNTRSRTASVSMAIPLQRSANLKVARCGFVIAVLEMQLENAIRLRGGRSRGGGESEHRAVSRRHVG